MGSSSSSSKKEEHTNRSPESARGPHPSSSGGGVSAEHYRYDGNSSVDDDGDAPLPPPRRVVTSGNLSRSDNTGGSFSSTGGYSASSMNSSQGHGPPLTPRGKHLSSKKLRKELTNFLTVWGDEATTPNGEQQQQYVPEVEVLLMAMITYLAADELDIVLPMRLCKLLSFTPVERQAAPKLIRYHPKLHPLTHWNRWSQQCRGVTVRLPAKNDIEGEIVTNAYKSGSNLTMSTAPSVTPKFFIMLGMFGNLPLLLYYRECREEFRNVAVGAARAGQLHMLRHLMKFEGMSSAQCLSVHDEALVLHAAASSNCPRTLQFVVREFGCDLYQPYPYGSAVDSVIRSAIRTEAKQMLLYLANTYPELVEQDTKGALIQSLACFPEASSVPLIKCLLKVGAVIADVRPLIDAASMGYAKTVSVLVDGMVSQQLDPTAMCSLRQQTALHAAAVEDRADVAEVLLRKCGRPMRDKKDPKGRTALHFAVSTLRVATVLLEHGADPNAAATDGETPLHLAARYGNAAAVQLLLAHSANPSSLNQLGRTPRHYAQNAGHHYIHQLLLGHNR